MELNHKRKILEDDEFTTADLPFQISRAYFRGTNTPTNQWTIPLEPPMKLKNVVFISAYEEFTTHLNNVSKWKKKERLWYYFIMIFFPSLLPVYMRSVRKKKFKNLRNEISEASKGIWLNNEERRTHLVTKVIKVSASKDYTMAYMDFLDLQRDREFYNGPTLPLIFHLSGDGYFNSPFNINYKDCLVRSLSLLDQTESFIEIYIENLNSYLESLSFFEFLNLSENKFWSLIYFLHNNNNGILKKRNIKAELAILEYINKGNKTVKVHKSSHIDGLGEASQTYIFNFHFINKYPKTVRNIVDYCRYHLFKGSKDIKLAIIFSKTDQSTLTTRDRNPEIQAMSQKADFMSTYYHDKYKSSLRQTKISSPNFYESGHYDEKNSSESEDEQESSPGLFNNLKVNWNEPLLIKTGSENRNDVSKRSFSATGSVYSQASYCPNKIEVESYEDNENLVDMLVEEHPLMAFINRRHGRDMCYRVKIFLVSFYKLAFLRSSLPPKYPLLNLSIMIILLFLDVFAALMLFLLYEHEKQFQIPLVPYLFVYPFTIILSPIVALTAIFICKASFYRVFLNLNALTATSNIFLTLLFELVFLFCVGDTAKGQLRSTQSIEPIVLCLLKIGLKILLAYFSCKQLAFNENASFYSNKIALQQMVIEQHENTNNEGVSEVFKTNSTENPFSSRD